MNRLIKFRAWDAKNKRMYYQGEPDLETIHSFFHHHNENDELMQFTGLKDKDGKEIYEGDLIDTTDQTGNIASLGNPVYEIRFDGLEFIVRGDIKTRQIGLKEFKIICEHAGIPFKIIGNIHENPELLKNETITTKT